MYLAVVLVVSLLPSQSAPDPSGHWEGTIAIPEHELGVTIDLAKGSGGWIGTMSVAKTTAADVPLDDLVLEGDRLRFTAALPDRASFAVTLSPASATLSGTASNDAGSAPCELKRTGDAHVKLPPPSSALPKEFEGRWEGTIAARDKTVRVALKLWSADDGTARGTLVTVDPAGNAIPLTTVRVTARDLEFEARAVSGTYRGKTGASGEISGEWTQSSTHAALTFHRVTEGK